MSVPVEIIAIALVVESSWTIANEWRQILVEYVGLIMRRLTESYLGYSFRIAFVTYGLSDTLPSPILCRRFFTDYTLVVKAMREDQNGLAIGHTNSGGLVGMAALEGLVAGVELFDELAASVSDNPIPAKTVNHIIHIALSSADDSIHPTFNTVPELDQVTWDTLHEELRKRNIHYNLVAAKQNLETFSKLHRSVAVASKPMSPWFAVRPHHAILLSGLPTLPKPSKPTSKRPNDAPEQRQLEPKRARITDSGPAEPLPVKIVPPPPVQKTLTPRLAPPFSPAVVPSQPPAPVPVPAAVATASGGGGGPSNAARGAAAAAAVNPFKNLTPQGQQILIQRIRVAEAQLKELKSKIDEAKAAGKHEVAEVHSQDFAKKRASLDHFKQAISAQIINAQAMAAAAVQSQKAAKESSNNNNSGNNSGNNGNNNNSQAQQQPTFSPRMGNTGDTHHTPPPPPPNAPSSSSSGALQQMNPLVVAQILYQSQANPSGSSSGPGPQQPPQGQPPPFHSMGTAPSSSSPTQNPSAKVELTLQQLQKLMEQRNRHTGVSAATAVGLPPGNPQQGVFPPTFGSPGVRGGGGNNGNNQMVGQIGGGGGGMAGGMGMGMGQQGMGAGSATMVPMATPAVVWTGPIKWTGQGSNGKKEVQAVVSVHYASPMASHSNTWPPAFVLLPTQEPAVTMPQLQHWITLHKPIVCPIHPHQREQDQHNAQVYQTLVALLTARSLYATASWTTPSGSQTRNVLFFPFNNKLFGAFFPLTGIPEMPKMSTVGNIPPPPGAAVALPGGGPSASGPVPTLHPALAAQLERMSPDERIAFLTEAKRRHAQQQMAMQNMAMSNPSPGFNNMGTMPNRNPMMMNNGSNNNAFAMSMGMQGGGGGGGGPAGVGGMGMGMGMMPSNQGPQ